MWGHGGDTIVFHSDLFLIPNARVGFFISYNSAGSRPGSGRDEVQRAFLDRYFPEARSTPPPIPEGALDRAREVSGVYEVSRKSETNALSIMSLLGQIGVQANGPGLTIPTSKNIRGQTKRWVEVSPLIYRELGGTDRIAFRRDANGRISDLLPNMPISFAQRVPFWRSKTFLFPLVGGSFAFMQLTLLLWPVAALVRKRYGRALLPDRTSRMLYALSRVVCLLLVGMVAAFAIPLARVNDDIAYLGDKANPWLQTSHLLGWLGAAGLLIMIFATLRFWRTSGLGWWLRVHSTLLMFAALVFVWFAWRWHMLSPSLKF